MPLNGGVPTTAVGDGSMKIPKPPPTAKGMREVRMSQLFDLTRAFAKPRNARPSSQPSRQHSGQHSGQPSWQR